MSRALVKHTATPPASGGGQIVPDGGQIVPDGGQIVPGGGQIVPGGGQIVPDGRAPLSLAPSFASLFPSVHAAKRLLSQRDIPHAWYSIYMLGTPSLLYPSHTRRDIPLAS